ncbi:Beta-lactamase HcpA precursor [compost metagenome]
MRESSTGIKHPMDRAEIDVFLAKCSLQEETPAEVDAFVAWAADLYPAGAMLQMLATYRPIGDHVDIAMVVEAIEETGRGIPTPLQALRTLAFHEMRRIVSGEISPEEGAGNIDNYVSGSPVEHDDVARLPEVWNFCVYRRYLRGAADVASDAWYSEVVRDIVAEAEFHLGLRDQPPGNAEPREPAPMPDRPTAPRPTFSSTDVLAAARSGVDLYELAERQASLAPALSTQERSAEECYALALAYENGTGVTRDMAQAVNHYRKAAELGHAAAMNNLGCLYDKGSGVPANRAQAIQYWQQAADRGNVYAQCSIGFAHESGNGLPQDHQQALAWYRRSAEGGCGPAHANLGNYYMAGIHVPHDLRQAAFHFQRGAELGEARAQYKLGTLYQQGAGVARDAERAADWFRRAYETLERRTR